MTHVLRLTAAVAALTLAGCEPFATDYQYVEDTELRLLDFIYEPADASPGDTVTLTAVFAGRRDIDLLDDIKWFISFNVIRNMLGTETVIDSTDLKSAAASYRPVAFEPNAQAVEFRIPIPDSIVYRSASIPERWIDMFPQYMVNEIREMLNAELGAGLPFDLTLIPKAQVIGLIERAAAEGVSIDPRILQIFTVPIRVTAKLPVMPGRLPHSIRSSQTIRYNNRFRSKGIDGIDINRNLRVDSVIVYKVKGKDLMFFNSKTEEAEKTFKITDFNNDSLIIEVQNGYSYFIEAASDSRLDYTTTMDGNRAAETHRAYWQFTLDTEEIKGVRPANFMDFGSIMGSGWSLTPPSDKRIERFTFWVTVKDEVINERLRPEGSTLRGMPGRFAYK